MHPVDRGLEAADDDVLLAFAAEEGPVLVSGDTDFGSLLALARRRSPSVILFRSWNTPHATDQARIILEHLENLSADLEEGAVVVITDDRIRVRRLPLLHDT